MMQIKRLTSVSSSTLLWGGLVVVVLLVAYGLRAVNLDLVPPGLRYDENLSHVMAQRVMAGERPLYFHESWGREPLYFYVQAASLSWWGESVWALRWPSVVFGLLGVVGSWLVADKLFGRRVGLLTAVLVTVSFWFIFYARIGSRVGTTTMFAAFTVYFLWQALDLDRSPPDGRAPHTQHTQHTQPHWQALLWAIGAGLFLGTNIWVYVAGRMGFALWLGLGIYLLIWHRAQFQRRWWAWLLTGAMGLLVAYPLFSYLQTNPQAEQRLDLLNQPLNELWAGNPAPVLDLTVRGVGMYVWEGEQDWLYNVFGRPIFDPLTAVVFILGIGLALWQWRDARYVLLVGWLVAGTLPAMLAPPAASLTHTIYAQPAALILVAVGLDWLWHRLDAYRAPLGAMVAVGIVAWYAALSWHAYFVVWRLDPAVRELYQGGITAVAHDYRTHHPEADQPLLVAAPYINYWHPWNAVSFEMASYPAQPPARWFNPAGGLVWLPTDEPTILYVPTDPLSPQTVHPFIDELFVQAVGEHLTDNRQADLATFMVTDTAVLNDHIAQLAPQTSLAWPPGVGEGQAVPTLPLHFNEQLALLAVEQLDTNRAVGEPILFATYWEVLTPDDRPIVAFTHLTDDGVAIWGQQDWFDVRLKGLQTGDRFVQLHQLFSQPETPAGLYQLQLGLYYPESGVRLPITHAGREADLDGVLADRVWVGSVTLHE